MRARSGFPRLVILAACLLAGCRIQAGQPQAPVPGERVSMQAVRHGAWTSYAAPAWVEKKAQDLELPTVYALAQGPDGGWWFGTTGGPAGRGDGIYRLQGGDWRRFGSEAGAPVDEVSALAVGADGALWAGTNCCGLMRFNGQTWRKFDVNNGLPENDVRAIAAAPDGAVWVGFSEAGAARWDGAAWQRFTRQEGLYGNYVGGIYFLPDGAVLLSTSNGVRAGLDVYRGGIWQPFPAPWNERGVYTTGLAQAADGSWWASTEKEGVYRFADDTRWSKFGPEEGLPGLQVNGIAAAPDGTIWIGTAQGLASFDGQLWRLQTSGWAGPLLAGADGSLWAGGYGEIMQLSK